MRTSATSCLAVAAVALALAAPLGGCAPMPTGPSRPVQSLPRYAGDAVDLFDDVIDPQAVGLGLEGRVDPKGDARVRTRAQGADMVVRGRVATVTNEVVGPDKVYRIGFRTTERLAGKADLGEEFTVHVDRSSPAMGVVKSFEGRLVGKTFVVFVKEFARPDGTDRELHFHADVDAPDMVAAVKEAVVLDEVK